MYIFHKHNKIINNNASHAARHKGYDVRPR